MDSEDQQHTEKGSSHFNNNSWLFPFRGKLKWLIFWANEEHGLEMNVDSLSFRYIAQTYVFQPINVIIDFHSKKRQYTAHCFSGTFNTEGILLQGFNTLTNKSISCVCDDGLSTLSPETFIEVSLSCLPYNLINGLFVTSRIWYPPALWTPHISGAWCMKTDMIHLLWAVHPYFVG